MFMGMRLTSEQLRGLADKLDELQAINVDVRIFTYEQHGIVVERSETMLSGPHAQAQTPTLIVRGITDRPSGLVGHGGTSGNSGTSASATYRHNQEC